MSFINAIMGSVLKDFLHFDLPVLCASVLLNYLLDLVMLHYMSLIMVYIIYRYVFVCGAVVFDRVGQLSEFALG